MTTPPRPPGDQMITTQDRDWPQLAACRHADPELFFPVSASGPSLDQVTQAKATSGGYPCGLAPVTVLPRDGVLVDWS